MMSIGSFGAFAEKFERKRDFERRDGDGESDGMVMVDDTM